MSNLLLSIGHMNISDSIPLFLDLLMALVLIPVISLIILGFCGRLIQRLFAYDFGPKFQVLIGGIGAGLHELLQFGTALITGHTLRYTHSVVLACIKRGDSLMNIDHYWKSGNIFQETGDFFVGVVPLYALSGIIIMWQTLLCGGNPFVASIRDTPISDYMHPSELLSICSTDFHTAFSGASLLFIIFLIGIIELASSGYNFSVNECGYTARGLILWACVQVILCMVITLTGFAPQVESYLAIIANYGIFITMRGIFYLIVIGILLLPFAFLNKMGSKIHYLFHRG